MNMERPVVSLPNFVICIVILYLTAQNLNGSEINQKMLRTFGEKPEMFILVLDV